MAKDTFYFQHDYEPLSDPKLLALVGEYGAAGYGIFWRIVEMLHSDESHRLGHEKYIYSAIAKQMSTPVEQVEEVINYAIEVCKLFVSDGESFWSERVYRNVEKREEIADKKRKAGLASAQARAEMAKKSTRVEHLLTPVEQNPTEGNKEKERKEKEIKENNNKEGEGKPETAKRFQAPTLEEIKDYISLKGYSVDPELFIDHYASNGWMIGKNKMKDWKSALNNWNRREKDRNSNKLNYGNSRRQNAHQRHGTVSCIPGDNSGSSTL